MKTIEGGCYKDAVGDGYHDANGKPVPAPESTSETTEESVSPELQEARLELQRLRDELAAKDASGEPTALSSQTLAKLAEKGFGPDNLATTTDDDLKAGGVTPATLAKIRALYPFAQ